MIKTVEELKKASFDIRRDLLTLCFQKGIHIGGDLSIADVMTVLWQYKLFYNVKDVHDEKRDRFILSKGHAAAVTSLNQAAIGCFDKEDFFSEYGTDGGRFSMHSCKLVNPYVEVSTGSLGHGLSIATGIAEALRRKNNFSSRVFVVMGDGEQAEGSIWEAAMHAQHYKLGNIVAVIDNNNISADGFISELTGLNDIGAKYKIFGWNVVEINGHVIKEIKEAFDSLPAPESDIPTVIVCHTIKGHGVSYMENTAAWHAGKLTAEQFEIALNELAEEEDNYNG